MAFSAFINFGDIKGESTDKDHKDWVVITHFDHQVSSAQKNLPGQPTEAVQLSQFKITKLLDAATPKLEEAACKGTHIPEVTIECWRAGEKPLKYYEVKLREVLVTGVATNGDSKADQVAPTEIVSMTFGAIEWTYTKQKPDGSAGGNVSAQWSVVKGAAA